MKHILQISLSTIVVLLISLFKYMPYSDISAAILLLVLLLIDLVDYSRRVSARAVLIYYLSWIFISLGVVYLRNSTLTFWTPLVLVVTLKVVALAVSYLKFKRLYMTKTVLGYLWFTSFVLYLIELVVNSTHGLGALCVKLAFVSVIEHLLLVLIQKKPAVYISSVVHLAWTRFKKDR